MGDRKNLTGRVGTTNKMRRKKKKKKKDCNRGGRFSFFLTEVASELLEDDLQPVMG
jgi:hypothetical protein